ncbi:MAG: thioredoxin family protein [Verrucomicrobiota bacterium]|nr:thioredoxin family protein [Verrucomicrobiota bacterium]
MKNFRLAVIAAGILALGAFGCQKKTGDVSGPADSSEWLTDFKRAQEIAKANNKALLLEFTGSDWCPPCIQLKKEIFASAEFKNYAAQNLVLVELDFPRAKEQTAELVTQNQQLAETFGVGGYPFIVLLRSDGTRLGERVGYDAGETPASFIAWMESLRKG